MLGLSTESWKYCIGFYSCLTLCVEEFLHTAGGYPPIPGFPSSLPLSFSPTCCSLIKVSCCLQLLIHKTGGWSTLYQTLPAYLPFSAHLYHFFFKLKPTCKELTLISAGLVPLLPCWVQELQRGGIKRDGGGQREVQVGKKELRWRKEVSKKQKKGMKDKRKIWKQTEAENRNKQIKKGWKRNLWLFLRFPVSLYVQSAVVWRLNWNAF